MKTFATVLLMVVTMGLTAQNNYSFSGSDIKFEDVTFKSSMKLGDEALVYNGGGVRTKIIFDLYEAGLYLTGKTGDANTVINGDKAMAVRLEITSGLVSEENFVEAIQEGFDKTAPAKAAEFTAWFKGALGGALTKGDEIILAYTPGEGTTLYKNGKNLGTQAGIEFKKALWAIWLGEQPAQESLKKEMLGK
ncbi:MAG: hypothetical protein RL754_1390 [Bacteroidota bacterium]